MELTENLFMLYILTSYMVNAILQGYFYSTKKIEDKKIEKESLFMFFMVIFAPVVLPVIVALYILQGLFDVGRWIGEHTKNEVKR